MHSNNSTALATYDLTLQKLAPSLPRSVKKPVKDPQFSGKTGDAIAKIRLLPLDRAPKSFWSSSWCFYEIGVGRYEIGRANFGGVQFVMYPNSKQCGSGRYLPGVTAILKSLKAGPRKGFFLNLSGGRSGAAILCGFHYCLGEFREFPVETAADDLAWLIQQTLGKFAALR